MTLLALIRHGATAWNLEGRMQGRADIGLSPAGLAELKALQTPAVLADAVWLSSPLRRAVQTAAALNGPPRVEDRLIETDWAAWEGLTADVTQAHAARIAQRGSGGLRFRAPGGESPGDVQQRLSDLFRELGPVGGKYVGVTHKGVIRAALSLATGWDMHDKPPVRLGWRAAHLFDISTEGLATLHAANVALERRP